MTRTTLREVNKDRGKKSLWRWFKESRNAELVVIFGEDLAALLGLAFAFVAVSIAWATGNVMWDALGSIAIGVLLIVGSTTRWADVPTNRRDQFVARSR